MSLVTNNSVGELLYVLRNRLFAERLEMERLAQRVRCGFWEWKTCRCCWWRNVDSGMYQ